jgi:hypothetical protein
MIVQNTTGSPTGGTSSSFRGINVEGGTTEWGDGTNATFFLPSTPARHHCEWPCSRSTAK